MDWVSRWRHRVVLEWGRSLDCVRLNSLRIDRVDGCFFIAKGRRWYAPLLIAVGNAYLRQIGLSARVLTNQAWRQWECEVYRRAYGSVLLADKQDRVQIPLWRGRVLANFLAAPMHPASLKLQAVRLAAAALHRLHQLSVRWPDGRQRPFSHGDATVRNVIVTRKLDQATWFDFDMAHDETQPATWRHADDLRAMIFSAAKWFPEEIYADLVQSVLTSYADPAVSEPLSAAIIQSRDRPNSFHLAQSRLTYDQNRAIGAALLTAIGVA